MKKKKPISQEVARRSLAFVKDYFEICDCGSGGDHGDLNEIKEKDCWHCVTRSILDLHRKESK